MPEGECRKAEENDAVQQASVWLKKDSSLVRKRITIGLNDQTQVQVLSGLDPNDIVVTGYEVITKSGTKKAVQSKSPFLPQRPSQRWRWTKSRLR